MNKSITYALFLVFGIVLGALAFLSLTPSAPICAYAVEPIISPPAEEQVLAAINSAQKTLEIELFQFSHSGLKQALADAVQKGVSVRILLEPRVDSNLETASYLKERGVQVKWASTSFAYTHAKLALIDGKKVLVGSINWSKSALTKNREAAVLIDSPALAQEFEQTFEEDWGNGKEVS